MMQRQHHRIQFRILQIVNFNVHIFIGPTNDIMEIYDKEKKIFI